MSEIATAAERDRIFWEEVADEAEEHIISPGIWKYDMGDGILTLLDPFSKGVHHVLIKNEEYDASNEEEEENPYYILSQWDVVEFLYRNIRQLSAVVDVPIEKIGILSNRGTDITVHTVPSTMVCLEAFKKFLLLKTDILAIVDELNFFIFFIYSFSFFFSYFYVFFLI